MIKKLELKEIARKAILAVCPSLITEGFSRIKSKIEQQGTPFALISAFRGGRSNLENLEMDKQMRTMISAAGFPFVDNVSGGYLEEPEEGEEKVAVEEKSVLIYGDTREDFGEERTSLKDLAANLAQTFEQDSFILGEPMKTKAGEPVVDQDGNSQMNIRAYDQSGAAIEEPWAGPWTSLEMANNDDVYWSTIYGKKTKLVEIKDIFTSFKPKSMMDAMKKEHYVKAATSALEHLKK
jgi:hypothetical protein